MGKKKRSEGGKKNSNGQNCVSFLKGSLKGGHQTTKKNPNKLQEKGVHRRHRNLGKERLKETYRNPGNGEKKVLSCWEKPKDCRKMTRNHGTGNRRTSKNLIGNGL